LSQGSWRNKVLQFGRDVAALNSPLSSASGGLGKLAGVLGRIAGWVGVLAALDNARATPKGFQPSWTGLGGMSPEQIRNYVHRTGSGNLSPDVREHLRYQQNVRKYEHEPWQGFGHHGAGPVSVTNNFSVRLAPGTTQQQAKEIVRIGMAALVKSLAGVSPNQGAHNSNPYEPGFLHGNLMSPSVGLTA
jgi:hypothetical protein